MAGLVDGLPAKGADKASVNKLIKPGRALEHLAHLATDRLRMAANRIDGTSDAQTKAATGAAVVSH
jgi:hypothetical protein